MSEYLEGLNAILKIIDASTEPSYRRKMRLQEESQKRTAEHRAQLQKKAQDYSHTKDIELKDLTYQNQLVTNQLGSVDDTIKDLTSDISEYENILHIFSIAC